MPEPVVLASGSAIRAALLRAAGVSFVVELPRVDEEAVKQGLRAEGLSPRDQADALAEAKALSVSRVRPGFVIGSDQILAFEGRALDKARSREEAKARLLELAGKTHLLCCAAVIANAGAAIWRRIEVSKLTMRALTPGAAEAYLDRAGEGVLDSVGAYQLEGLGAQLFDAIEGDYFSILGLPLLPVLGFLRQHGVGGLVMDK